MVYGRTSNELFRDVAKWERELAKSVMGTVNGSEAWGVDLQTPANRLDAPNFTGDKPPYGLIFVFGDPDSGHALILKRR